MVVPVPVAEALPVMAASLQAQELIIPSGPEVPGTTTTFFKKHKPTDPPIVILEEPARPHQRPGRPDPRHEVGDPLKENRPPDEGTLVDPRN